MDPTKETELYQCPFKDCGASLQGNDAVKMHFAFHAKHVNPSPDAFFRAAMMPPTPQVFIMPQPWYPMPSFGPATPTYPHPDDMMTRQITNHVHGGDPNKKRKASTKRESLLSSSSSSSDSDDHRGPKRTKKSHSRDATSSPSTSGNNSDNDDDDDDDGGDEQSGRKLKPVLSAQEQLKNDIEKQKANDAAAAAAKPHDPITCELPGCRVVKNNRNAMTNHVKMDHTADRKTKHEKKKGATFHPHSDLMFADRQHAYEVKEAILKAFPLDEVKHWQLKSTTFTYPPLQFVKKDWHVDLVEESKNNRGERLLTVDFHGKERMPPQPAKDGETSTGGQATVMMMSRHIVCRLTELAETGQKVLEIQVYRGHSPAKKAKVAAAKQKQAVTPASSGIVTTTVTTTATVASSPAKKASVPAPVIKEPSLLVKKQQKTTTPPPPPLAPVATAAATENDKDKDEASAGSSSVDE